MAACSKEFLPPRSNPPSMNISDSRRGIYVELPLSKSKHDLDRTEVFFVERQVLLEFTP